MEQRYNSQSNKTDDSSKLQTGQESHAQETQEDIVYIERDGLVTNSLEDKKNNSINENKVSTWSLPANCEDQCTDANEVVESARVLSIEIGKGMSTSDFPCFSEQFITSSQNSEISHFPDDVQNATESSTNFISTLSESVENEKYFPASNTEIDASESEDFKCEKIYDIHENERCKNNFSVIDHESRTKLFDKGETSKPDGNLIDYACNNNPKTNTIQDPEDTESGVDEIHPSDIPTSKILASPIDSQATTNNDIKVCVRYIGTREIRSKAHDQPHKQSTCMQNTKRKDFANHIPSKRKGLPVHCSKYDNCQLSGTLNQCELSAGTFLPILTFLTQLRFRADQVIVVAVLQNSQSQNEEKCNTRDHNQRERNGLERHGVSPNPAETGTSLSGDLMTQSCESKDDYKYEQARYNTFWCFPLLYPISPTLLARQGFYYENDGDEVVCFCCKVRHSRWRSGDDIPAVHARISPDCPFVNGQQAGNIPIQEASNLPQTAGAISSETGVAIRSRAANEHNPLSLVNSDNSQDEKNDRRPKFISESDKLAVKKKDVELQRQQEVERQLCEQNSPGALGINTERPQYPNYAVVTIRAKTFSGFPPHPDQTPMQMAKAGFFSDGFKDHVCCFYCGGKLRDWDPGDDPWVEHARWFPRCAFVIISKGQPFIDRVLETRSTQHENSTAISLLHSDQQSSNACVTENGDQTAPPEQRSEGPSEESREEQQEKRRTESPEETPIAQPQERREIPPAETREQENPARIQSPTSSAIRLGQTRPERYLCHACNTRVTSCECYNHIL